MQMDRYGLKRLIRFVKVNLILSILLIVGCVALNFVGIQKSYDELLLYLVAGIIIDRELDNGWFCKM